MLTQSFLQRFALVFLFLVQALSSVADSLTLTFTDQSGKPVNDAVACITGPGLTPPVATGSALIVQRDKTFRPLVTLIHTGMRVEFPNEDCIMHHVYSFSKPKKIDIPLYKDQKPQPVVFDKAGLVVLGCNIHDWMKAYVYVTDAPVYGKSKESGTLGFTLPPGSYSLELWHPRLKKVQGESFPKTISVGSGKPTTYSFSLEIKKESTANRAPTLEPGGSY